MPRKLIDVAFVLCILFFVVLLNSNKFVNLLYSLIQ